MGTPPDENATPLQTERVGDGSTDADPALSEAHRQSMLSKNLSALASSQPDWHDRVAQATPSAHRLTRGRDGQPTFLIEDAEGEPTWFGGSSMPRTSAEALFSALEDPDSSAILPGVLTGYDPRFLLGRLRPHCALFVCEDDPGQIRLAMQLYDYAAAMQAGRLIWAGFGTAGDDLVAFFHAHTGYEFPRRLLRVPQIPSKVFQVFQNQVQSAAVTVQRERTAQIQRLATPSLGDSFTRPRDDSHVVVLSTSREAHTLRWLPLIEEALGDLGKTVTRCSATEPAQAHPLARVRTVVDHEPDLALFIDSLPGPLGSTRSQRLPIVSWLLPPDLHRPYLLEPGPRSTPTYVATADLIEPARSAGVAKTDLVLLDAPMALSGSALHSSPLSHRPADRASPLVLAEILDDRADSVQVSLPTHLDLYEALRRLCRDRLGADTGAEGSALLDEAQRATAVEIRDDSVRSAFLALIRTRIHPAAMTSAVVRHVKQFWPDARCVGRFDGCPEATAPGGACPAIPLDSVSLARLLEGRPIVVFPYATAASSYLVLTALAMACPIVCYRYSDDLAATHPQSHAALDAVSWFKTPAQAARILRHLVRTGGRPEPDHDQAEQIARQVRSEHSMLQRVRFLLDAI